MSLNRSIILNFPKTQPCFSTQYLTSNKFRNSKPSNPSQKLDNVRVRFAPSPTGHLHLGGLRTAIFNVLFAKKHNGKFILRIEDTDSKRFVPGSVENILSTLEWAGIKVDEGINIGGDYGPYIQSERNHIYQEYANKLLKTLEQMKLKASGEGRIPVYDKRCSRLSPTQLNMLLNSEKKYTIRLKCPSDTLKFTDAVYGTVQMGVAQQDDAVLIKSDGTPTYHFAHPIDDHLMKISHVFRGEEWLPSTPKHLAIFKAFGWTPPVYVHLPLIFGQNHKKLSKRSGNTDVLSYKEKGYLPEALVNFLSFLGWAPKKHNGEVRSIDQLAKSLDDPEKLESISIDLQPVIQNHLGLKDKPLLETVKSALDLCRGQLTFINDLATVADYFFVQPDVVDPEKLKIIDRIAEWER
ncbi:hypothetical protein BB560_006354, partial [Smittium megazygosporum]